MDIIIGLAIVAVLALSVYFLRHHAPSQAPFDPKVIQATVASEMEARLATLREDIGTLIDGVPALVSSQVAQLQADLASALQRAQAAEDKIEADAKAHAEALAAVAARVAAAVTSSPELPASVPASAPAPAPAPAPALLNVPDPESN